jgi:DNA-directed RNA polymerase subunit alpha
MHILHNDIGAPQLKIDVKSADSAIMTVTPLPAGYGVTVGNALRRVLLSSLPGTAVTAMKIEGATHEYTTVPGVKESVFDIMLNLRELCLCKHTKGTELIEVAFKKTGEIRAKDLKVSSDIDILDPEHLIATCDGADPKRKIYIRVEKGVGYTLISNKDNEKEEDPEFILMDADFSPITHVRYSVAPARVGDLTDLDALELTVKTDGGIEAAAAIKLSAGILANYFTLFNNEEAYTDEEFTTSFEQMKKKRESEELAAAKANETSFTPIDILGLSQRTLNALVNGGIASVEDLLKTPMSQLVQLRGFGQKAKTELDSVLKERGYVIQPLSKS